MDVLLIPILGMLTLFLGLPAVVFLFIYNVRKSKTDIERLRHQKEILALEVRKQEMKLRVLEQENKIYDRQLSAEIDRSKEKPD